MVYKTFMFKTNIVENMNKYIDELTYKETSIELDYTRLKFSLNID